MKYPEIIPISHASFLMRWDDDVIAVDPTGGASAYVGRPMPTVVLITDIHGDHFEPATIRDTIGTAELYVPQAVMDQLPEDLATHAHVIGNGESRTVGSLRIEALPMYNVPEKPESLHPKGRGNGYIIEKDGVRVYVAGDTSVTPEMEALSDISLAFLPMNLPYTMGIEEAAAGVAAFKPKRVYPYHYRSPDGYSDVARFKKLAEEKCPGTEVVLLAWYPGRA